MEITSIYQKAERVVESSKNYKQFLTAKKYCELLINLPGHYCKTKAEWLGSVMLQKRKQLTIIEPS